MNSRSRLSLSAPIAGGLIAYLVYRGLYIPAKIYGMNVGFAAHDLSVRHDLPLVGLPEVLGRLSWSVTGTFFVLAIIGSAILLAYVILEALRDQPGKIRNIALATTFVAAAGVASTSWGDNPFVVKSLNSIVLQAFDLLKMPRAGSFLNVFTPMLLAVTVLLITAAWATLLGKPVNKETPETLKDQIRKLNLTLYVGATMIVAGIVFANSIHLLPGALLDEARTDDWNTLVDGLSTSMGAIWTLLLLGIYLPSIAILRMRARELALGSASTGETAPDIGVWQKQHGLAPQFRERLVQMVALLSPLIIGGPAAPFLRLLTG